MRKITDRPQRVAEHCYFFRKIFSLTAQKASLDLNTLKPFIKPL